MQQQTHKTGAKREICTGMQRYSEQQVSSIQARVNNDSSA